MHVSLLKPIITLFPRGVFLNDEAKFIEDLQSVPWDTINAIEDTDYVIEAWLDLFHR